MFLFFLDIYKIVSQHNDSSSKQDSNTKKLDNLNTVKVTSNSDQTNTKKSSGCAPCN
jgi:hypothetical protein